MFRGISLIWEIPAQGVDGMANSSDFYFRPWRAVDIKTRGSRYELEP